MDAYGRFYSRVLFPVWESGLRRRPTLQRLRYLEETQWRPLDELQAVQAGRLRALLEHAHANVPYYRRRFEEAGLHPRDIRGADDLGRLPILERDEARDTVDERTATAGAALEVKKSTSGTMGRPLVFGYELASEYWRQAMKLRGYAWAGYLPGQRSLHYWGSGPPAVGKPNRAARLRHWKTRADRTLRRETYVDCGHRADADLQHVVEVIRQLRPEVMLCYSQAGADLARYVVARGLRTWDTIPVLCGAERLLPADRAALEQAFGPAVFETYGCREVMLIGTECPAHTGLHVSMETLIVEVVVRDGAGGGAARPARPGETGEVVITDLTNRAMPFIRYANGDLATAGEPGTCSCGRALTRLASVEGRVTETLVDAAGARVNGLVFNVVIAHLAHAIRQFQVVQHKDRSVTLRVAPTETFGADVEAALRQTWMKYLAGVPVRLELVPDIPVAASGKRQVVVVER